jgi:hypothetical protein
MKRLLWLVVFGLVVGLALTAAAQQQDSGTLPTEAQAKHKHHRHHKNPHKGHIDHDQYPSFRYLVNRP